MQQRPGHDDWPVQEPVPVDHRLPSGLNKVERITQHTKGIFEDLKDWTDLRIKLVQIEVQQQIQTKVNQVVMRTIPLIVAGVASLFFLVTVALGLGWWLGHPFWGFLIVTLLIVGAAGGLLFVNRKMLQDPRSVVKASIEKISETAIP